MRSSRTQMSNLLYWLISSNGTSKQRLRRRVCIECYKVKYDHSAILSSVFLLIYFNSFKNNFFAIAGFFEVFIARGTFADCDKLSYIAWLHCVFLGGLLVMSSMPKHRSMISHIKTSRFSLAFQLRIEWLPSIVFSPLVRYLFGKII